MSAIKDGRYPIMLDKERHLLFNLNVLDELQDKAGGYDKLDEFLNRGNKDLFKNLKWLLTLLINEGADDDDELVSERQIGKMIHMGNMNKIFESIFVAFSKGSTGEEVLADLEYDNEDEEKNAISGQG